MLICIMGIESPHQIVVSLDELRQMDLYFVSQWHRQPTVEEFNAMVEDKVREEVLYREALAIYSSSISMRGARSRK